MKSPFSFLKKRTKKTVGLDIGSYNLKVAEIEKNAETCRLTAVGTKDIRQTTDLPGAIRQLFEEAKITSKDVNISLAGEGVVARHLSLPKMNEEEVKKAIMYKLEDHIPFKPEDAYVDFHIVGEELSSKNKIRVFLVATRKDFLDSRVELIKKAGLNPQIITMDTLAGMNTFYLNYPEKTQTNITLLNIGDKTSNLLIARDKTPYFVRDASFGGESVTALLQSKLALNKEEAEELKHTLKNASAETYRIIKTTIATLLNEIFVSIDFFENLTEQKIEEVYLSGGTAQLFGLTEFLSGYLNLEIIPLNPFKNLPLAPYLDKETIQPLAPYLSVAVGLALEQN